MVYYRLLLSMGFPISKRHKVLHADGTGPAAALPLAAELNKVGRQVERLSMILVKVLVRV